MIRLFEIFVCRESTRIFTHWSFLCPSNRQMCNQPFFSLLYAYIVPCYPRMTKLISMLKFLNIVCALSRITITENNVCFISFCEKALVNVIIKNWMLIEKNTCIHTFTLKWNANRNEFAFFFYAEKYRFIFQRMMCFFRDKLHFQIHSWSAGNSTAKRNTIKLN